MTSLTSTNSPLSSIVSLRQPHSMTNTSLLRALPAASLMQSHTSGKEAFSSPAAPKLRTLWNGLLISPNGNHLPTSAYRQMQRNCYWSATASKPFRTSRGLSRFWKKASNWRQTKGHTEEIDLTSRRFISHNLPLSLSLYLSSALSLFATEHISPTPHTIARRSCEITFYFL